MGKVAIVLLLITCSLHVDAQQLWYAKPAVNWNEALPLGNGRIGAMVYGGVRRERLSLNEQTLWSGGPRDWNNPEAKKYLPLVREAVMREDYHAADSLSKFMQGPYTESYLPMADLVFEYDNIDDSTNYRRELDLNHSLSRVWFTTGNHKITRTAFASFPDRALVYHDSSSSSGIISYKLFLTSKLKYTVESVQPGLIILKGKAPKHVEPAYLWKIKDSQAIQYAQNDTEEGMTFEVQLIVKTNGGRVDVDGKSLRVTNANSTTVILAAATSFNGFDKSPGLQGLDPSKEVNARMNAVRKKTYAQLLSTHQHDYKPIFNRMKIEFDTKRNSDLPTDERLKRMNDATDFDLVATIMQYTRYLLISGSRPGGQPVNLKGIWNDKVRPEYSSNWCIDHDAQMFYYPVETNNLSEMHEPFLDLIKSLSVNGKKTAQINYGMNGWCAHHNTDIWASTAPVGNYGEGNPHWANWNMSGPWLSAHMYDHYRFTGDKKFLADEAWPVMKGAALFCLDWLVRDNNGIYQTLPSVSPENTFITAKNDTAQVSKSTTADIALIRELFLNCIEVANILKIEKPLADKLKATVSHLPDYSIGSSGQLLEWQHEWRSLDPGHRHLSHMYPVFPGGEISPVYTPALSNASKKALALRTRTNGSWGFTWKAACWARLGEGDSAWNTLSNQLRYVDARSKSSKDNYGLYPNFFNSEVPATILNGNGGTNAALTEMLLQSHKDLHLLPALPNAFPSGSVHGLRARNGFVVDLSWVDHQLNDAIVYSSLGNECKLRTGTTVKIFSKGKEIATRKEDGAIVFKTIRGGRYEIKPIKS